MREAAHIALGTPEYREYFGQAGTHRPVVGGVVSCYSHDLQSGLATFINTVARPV